MSDYVSFFNNTVVRVPWIALSAGSHVIIIISMIKPMRMISALRVMNDDIFSYFIRKSFKQSRYSIKYFIKVHTKNFVCGNVRHVLVEPAMNVNIVINHEARMSESFDVVHLVPV